MTLLRIHGGIPLEGEVRVCGSKNAALPMMAAAILADEPVRLQGVPHLTDVRTLAHVLRRLGMDVRRTDDDDLLLETVDPAQVRAPYRLVERMRASFCVLGPLLAKRGRAEVPLPGGCNFGQRPVELHLKGLAALGAKWRLEHGYIIAEAERLVGAEIDLLGPRGTTVTGTANVLMAAALAEGTTTIAHAAREPEIVDLGRLLNKMGAKISGLGTTEIHIEGGMSPFAPRKYATFAERKATIVYRIIPDRIEAATLLLAAAITRGGIKITGVVPEHLAAVLDLLKNAGAEIAEGSDWISLKMDRRPRPGELSAEPYPGVPTDVQAQWTALVALAHGTSRVRDTVFENRFLHAAELNRLGAKIAVSGDTAFIEGVPQLSAAAVTASDLRASAALVLAGLAAHGETRIHAVRHLDRGYERLDQKLTQLGARIERCQIATPLAHWKSGRG
jgi:UDP-N-acetylglucosamine 1-carboxyvinyltransferase